MFAVPLWLRIGWWLFVGISWIGRTLMPAPLPPDGAAECVIDEDCGAGEACMSGSCRAAPQADCVEDADCAEGEVCTAGQCVVAPPAPEPAVRAEVGYSNDVTGEYRAIAVGEEMPLFTSGQGGSHILATIRAAGFPPPVDGVVGVTLAQKVTLVSTGAVLHDFSQILPFRPTEDGGIEFERRFVFLDTLPSAIDGQEVQLTFTLTSFDDPSIVVVIDEMVVLKMDQE